MFVMLITINPANSSINSYHLKECFVISHCSKSNLEAQNVEDLYKKAKVFVEKMPRTKIIEQSDFYIHAEVKSKIMKFTDDLELGIIPEEKILEIRSESRVGIGDMGVNKKESQTI